MFGWLRKSSKEPSHSKSNKSSKAPTNYVHVDGRVKVKPLDEDFNKIEEATTRDRPHSVTAARPFFEANKHLDQQKQKQNETDNIAQSDDEDNYNNADDDQVSSDESHSQHIKTEIQEKPKKTKLRTFKQKNIKDAPKLMITNTTNIAPSIQETKPIKPVAIIKESNPKHTSETDTKQIQIQQHTENKETVETVSETVETITKTVESSNNLNVKTRGFSKRESKSKQIAMEINTKRLQRRRSSSKKTRTFTPPTTKGNMIEIKEEDKQRRNKVNIVQKEENKENTENTENKENKENKDNRFDDDLVNAIEKWLKDNNLWFNSKDKGSKLLYALLESGIENAQDDLSILSVSPDLTEIAAMAGLNILERRKFINVAHSSTNEFSSNIDNNGNKNTVHVVMSTEEQCALARMDCIIEQLKHTRNLIKNRISSINNGVIAYEDVIRGEFAQLRDLLSEREEKLITEMRDKVRVKIVELNDLDHDMLLSLQECQKSKISAQKLMKTDREPRVSRSKWRILESRKKAVIESISSSISHNISNHKNALISELICWSMSLRDIMPSLPKPLIAQYFDGNGAGKGMNSYPHHHRRHYDELNPFLLNIFTKNTSQIHLEMSVAGFAFNYTERMKTHRVLREYGMICDVEECVRNELDVLFASSCCDSYNVLCAKMMLINPQHYLQKKYKDCNYATLSIDIELNEVECAEWRLIGDGDENWIKSSVLNTKRMKEIEIQIGMKRRHDDGDGDVVVAIDDDEALFGWISLGWIDVVDIVENTKEDVEERQKRLKIAFVLKKDFQELMTQCLLASLELEFDSISKQELEEIVVSQLSTDELFEFNSRNVDEFGRKFTICIRIRYRDRMSIVMNGIKSECNLIVFQSPFSSLRVISFCLLRPVISVLAENRANSAYLNGFVSIVGNESLQFIDPIGDKSCILSSSLPRDVDSCGLIIDFIRFKHAAFDSEQISSTHTHDDDAGDDALSLFRNANNKKLCVLRLGGARRSDSDGERILCGRLDIYNIYSAQWMQIGEFAPFRENMSCTMFYGRVCVAGGNVDESGNSFIATDIVEEFSFSERKWKQLKCLNIARFGHCMCSFDEKPRKLFVYGGETQNGEWTNSIEIYDPPKRSWNEIGIGMVTDESQSSYNRYGSACCVWAGFGIILVGGQCEEDESSKHCELFVCETQCCRVVRDLNLEHGIFPAVWCDADDNCIYCASQYVVVDNKNKENSIIKYRVEMLDHPNNKWTQIKSNKHHFNTPNAFEIIKSSNVWGANAIRKSRGASVKLIH